MTHEKTSAPPLHVALIGCGFTGTSAFYQLVERYPVEKITIFEASGDFGPGYPYRLDEHSAYLLNNTTDTLCLTPGNRRAFVNWLRSRSADVDPKGHLPRSEFGAFLKASFEAARIMAAVKGVEVELIAEEALDLEEPEAGGVTIHTTRGASRADVAILTTGRCPDLDPFPHPPPGASARYVADHIRTDALDALPLDAEIHVIGASLSAYDVVNRLFAPETGCAFERVDGVLSFAPGPNARRVVLCSRSGRLKYAQSRAPAEMTRRHFAAEPMRAAARAEGGLSLASAAAAIRREAEAQGADVDWRALEDPYAGCATTEAVTERAGALLARAVSDAAEGSNFLVDLFQDAQHDLWDLFAEGALAPEAEQSYRRHYETATLAAAAPCPISTAERLAALITAGRLSVVAGARAPSYDSEADAYRIAHATGVETARFLINTAGAVNRDVTSPGQTPLIRHLARRGLLRPHARNGAPLLGAAVDMGGFRALGARRIYLANMLLWGPGYFTSSAYLMASIVERLLARLYAAPGAQP